jgi:hypothetical protein
MGYHGILWAVNVETTNKRLTNAVESEKTQSPSIMLRVVFAFANGPPNEQSHENMAIVCSCNVLTWSSVLTAVDKISAIEP